MCFWSFQQVFYLKNVKRKRNNGAIFDKRKRNNGAVFDKRKRNGRI